MMNARQVLALLAACAAFPSAALAQSDGWQRSSPGRARTIELTALAGYQLNTDVNTTSGQLSVGDAPVYGASLGVETAPGLMLEILWLYSVPEARMYTGPYAGSFDVDSHYFQIGGTQSVRREALELFGGGTLGAALFVPGTLRLGGGSSVALNDTWRFAFTLGAGLKVHLGDKVALRGEARVAAPVYFSSGAFYAGSGGAGLAVSGGIPLWQWNFLGGLVISP